MNAIAFNELLAQHYGYLQPFAAALTQNSEDAKDLTQETMYKAIANKEKYQIGTNIKAWLFTIMRNIFINNYRRQKKYSVYNTDTSDERTGIWNKKTTLNLGIVNNSVREIMAIIHRLPDVFRLSFEMHYMGYKYHEIAEVLQEPLGTVKSRIHFARKFLAARVAR